MIRRARLDELDAILALESVAFEPERRSSPGIWKRSLTSPHQEVWIDVEQGSIRASMVLWMRPNFVRVYSLANYSGVKGVARALLQFGLDQYPTKRWSLECTPSLVGYYAPFGFEVRESLPAYYPGTPAKDAVRMVRDPA